MPVQTKIQIRRDTAANWTSTNPTLVAGEIGFETDTSRFKIGDGSTAWTSLAYQNTNIPPSTNTTIVAADAGKYLNISAGVTINSSTGFISGDVVSIYNSSSSNITITATSITLRQAGTANTGNRTLAGYGVATVLCTGSNAYVISGAGLT